MANKLSKTGFVIAHNNRIVGWHKGLKEPVLLAQRAGNSPAKRNVNALVYHRQFLHDAGYYNCTYNTLGGQY